MKKFRNIITFAAVLIFSAAFANASVISFQIIQHDKSQNEVRASSYIIENALFETTDGAAGDMKVFSRSFYEAKLGHCNYFIVLTVDYDVRASRNPKGNFLSNINSVSWQVYDTVSSKVILEGSRDVGKVSAQRNNEKGIESFACEIAADIYDGL